MGHLCLRVQCPAVVSVVDHEFCLATVDADVLAGDEACLVGSQEQGHVGDVQRVAHPARRLLERQYRKMKR